MLVATIKALYKYTSFLFPFLYGGPDPHSRRGNFEGEKRPAQDMPGHIRRSIYLAAFGRWQHRYGLLMPIGVYSVDGGAYWCHLANTNEPSVCGGDAAYVKLLVCCLVDGDC